MLSAMHDREELVRYGAMVHQQGWVAATDGNLSVRLDEKTVLTTPTGVSKGRMKPEDMVVVDLDGNKLSGERDPSSELLMHLTIYRTRPDVKAVLHAHPPVATGFACAGIPLDQPMCAEVVVTLGAIPIAEYATTGTPQLSESLLPFLPDYDAILLANHGAVSYGCDLENAYFKMETVEHFAQVVLTTVHLGKHNCLSEENVRKLVEARTKYAGNRSQASLPPGPLGSKMWVLKSLGFAIFYAACANSELLSFA
ncbi:MAG: class II aldolase/adducin family protein [Acidobacteriales bacterium]|nr:class II aldolase/adducin family protein [Terriglobales bacterium]